MNELMCLLRSALDLSDRLTLAGLDAEHHYHAKGERDFALAVDLDVEREVKSILTASNIPVLGEELAWHGGEQAERFWVVDPVDGTINYSRQLPLFGTCIALVENGVPVMAGISLPLLRERYLAERGQGATLNGQPLRVSTVTQLDQALVGLGDFAVGNGSEEKNRTRFAVMQGLAPRVLRIRMLGSAAVQLAWLAAGRLDVSIILSNKAWDVQAGVLLAREAGALVFDGDGSDHTTASHYTMASVAGIKQALLECVTMVVSTQQGTVAE